MLRDIGILLISGKAIQGKIVQAINCYAKSNKNYKKYRHNPDETTIFLDNGIQTAFTIV